MSSWTLGGAHVGPPRATPAPNVASAVGSVNAVASRFIEGGSTAPELAGIIRCLDVGSINVKAPGSERRKSVFGYRKGEIFTYIVYR